MVSSTLRTIVLVGLGVGALGSKNPRELGSRAFGKPGNRRWECTDQNKFSRVATNYTKDHLETPFEIPEVNVTECGAIDFNSFYPGSTLTDIKANAGIWLAKDSKDSQANTWQQAIIKLWSFVWQKDSRKLKTKKMPKLFEKKHRFTKWNQEEFDEIIYQCVHKLSPEEHEKFEQHYNAYEVDYRINMMRSGFLKLNMPPKKQKKPALEMAYSSMAPLVQRLHQKELGQNGQDHEDSLNSLFEDSSPEPTPMVPNMPAALLRQQAHLNLSELDTDDETLDEEFLTINQPYEPLVAQTFSDPKNANFQGREKLHMRPCYGQHTYGSDI